MEFWRHTAQSARIELTVQCCGALRLSRFSMRSSRTSIWACARSRRRSSLRTLLMSSRTRMSWATTSDSVAFTSACPACSFFQDFVQQLVGNRLRHSSSLSIEFQQSVQESAPLGKLKTLRKGSFTEPGRQERKMFKTVPAFPFRFTPIASTHEPPESLLASSASRTGEVLLTFRGIYSLTKKS
jgi:hypothetical protein